MKIEPVDKVIAKMIAQAQTVWKPAGVKYGCWCPHCGSIVVLTHYGPGVNIVIFTKPAHNCFGFSYGLN